MFDSSGGTCLAWWYLRDQRKHAYLGVFLHRSSCTFTVRLTEGFLAMAGWGKDDFITKPVWDFDPSNPRPAYARVLKYANSIILSRKTASVAYSSFSPSTGSKNDLQMQIWEDVHGITLIYEPKVRFPNWWPLQKLVANVAEAGKRVRERIIKEGFDFKALIADAKAPSNQKRKKVQYVKVVKRIGRFSVYIADQ